MKEISLTQKVPTHLAFIVVLVLSFLTAWFSVSKAQEIIQNSKEDPAFNVQKRFQKKAPVLSDDNMKIKQ